MAIDHNYKWPAKPLWDDRIPIIVSGTMAGLKYTLGFSNQIYVLINGAQWKSDSPLFDVIKRHKVGGGDAGFFYCPYVPLSNFSSVPPIQVNVIKNRHTVPTNISVKTTTYVNPYSIVGNYLEAVWEQWSKNMLTYSS